MENMELDTDEILDNSPLKIYSSELASQDKMIIRIKKQEQDVDIEGKYSSTDHEEIVSYTCEFVQNVDETKSDCSDILDESMETVRQDENFIYPAITNSDDEDTSDVTWQPPTNILSSGGRVTRKNVKCPPLKDEKPVPKKKKCKNNKVNELAIKPLKKERTSKKKQVLEDIDVSLPAADFAKPVDITTSESVTKKISDSIATKVYKPRKGMATPKQRLGRIIKIHRMMK